MEKGLPFFSKNRATLFWQFKSCRLYYNHMQVAFIACILFAMCGHYYTLQLVWGLVHIVRLNISQCSPHIHEELYNSSFGSGKCGRHHAVHCRYTRAVWSLPENASDTANGPCNSEQHFSIEPFAHLLHANWHESCENPHVNMYVHVPFVSSVSIVHHILHHLGSCLEWVRNLFCKCIQQFSKGRSCPVRDPHVLDRWCEIACGLLQPLLNANLAISEQPKHILKETKRLRIWFFGMFFILSCMTRIVGKISMHCTFSHVFSCLCSWEFVIKCSIQCTVAMLRDAEGNIRATVKFCEQHIIRRVCKNRIGNANCDLHHSKTCHNLHPFCSVAVSTDCDTHRLIPVEDHDAKKTALVPEGLQYKSYRFSRTCKSYPKTKSSWVNTVNNLMYSFVVTMGWVWSNFWENNKFANDERRDLKRDPHVLDRWCEIALGFLRPWFEHYIPKQRRRKPEQRTFKIFQFMAFISVALVNSVTSRTGNHHAFDNSFLSGIQLCTWVACITCGSYHTMKPFWGPESTSQKNYRLCDSRMTVSMYSSSVGSIQRGFHHENIYHILQPNPNLQTSIDCDFPDPKNSLHNQNPKNETIVTRGCQQESQDHHSTSNTAHYAQQFWMNIVNIMMLIFGHIMGWMKFSIGNNDHMKFQMHHWTGLEQSGDDENDNKEGKGKRRDPHVIDRWCEIALNLSRPFLSMRTVGRKLNQGKTKFQKFQFLILAILLNWNLKDYGNSSKQTLSTHPFSQLRIGEALNPGPDPREIRIGNINPTQIFNKEVAFDEVGEGIWGCSETAHTAVAMQVSKQRFRNLGWYTCWSQATEPHRENHSSFKGKAGGTCIVSKWPLREAGEQLPPDIQKSTRLVDAYVQISPWTCVYIVCIYAPPRNRANPDVDLLMRCITNCAAERVLQHRGPAILMGDFNEDLCNIRAWESLRTRGWVDTHCLSAELNGHPLQPTCKNARHSFVLGNPIVAASLQKCITTETYNFSCHPTLEATFIMESLIQHGKIWSLPAATDDLIFDLDILEQEAQDKYDKVKQQIVEHLAKGNSDEAMKKFVLSYENMLSKACVDVEGNPMHMPAKCRGRSQQAPLRCKPLSMPVIKKGRPGDAQCSIPQPDVSLRRHTKQLRRIEALHFQRKALETQFTIHASLQCDELWQSILNATGFHRGFSLWITNFYSVVVPQNCPSCDFIHGLLQEFRVFHKKEESRVFLYRLRNRQINVSLDIEKGGKKAYQEVKEPPQDPLTHIVYEHRVACRKTKWKKQGLKPVMAS